MIRAPVVHLMLDFRGVPAPAMGTIWDYILKDPGVTQNLREATALGTDLVITAVTDHSGTLANRPYVSLRKADPAEMIHFGTYMFAAASPPGAAEVRVHLTGSEAATLADLLHRHWPGLPAFGPQRMHG